MLQRWGRPALVGLALVGLLAGLVVTLGHIAADPLADVHAYYDAGQRLNGGRPLYDMAGDVNAADFYRYPPLLAIAFRPLSLLPFPIAAALWEAAMIAAFAVTVRLIGLGPRLGIALGLLALPIGWSLAIGQAQVLVTLLLVVGSPVAVALAANLKLFPLLVAVYWVARREWGPLARLAAWMAVLALVQLILEPRGTIDFLGTATLGQVGEVNNLSPFAISPFLWAVSVAVLAVVAVRTAPTALGWPAAVALAVLATPRLLSYQLMTLLAALRTPVAEHSSPGQSVGVVRMGGEVAR